MTDLEMKCYHIYRTDDAGMGYDEYDYNIEISQDEYDRGREVMREGMKDLVLENL